MQTEHRHSADRARTFRGYSTDVLRLTVQQFTGICNGIPRNLSDLCTYYLWHVPYVCFLKFDLRMYLCLWWWLYTHSEWGCDIGAFQETFTNSTVTVNEFPSTHKHTNIYTCMYTYRHVYTQCYIFTLTYHTHTRTHSHACAPRDAPTLLQTHHQYILGYSNHIHTYVKLPPVLNTVECSHFKR